MAQKKQTLFRRSSNSRNTWPSRPGEEQYEWEEPRVVADSYGVGSVQPDAKTRPRKKNTEGDGSQHKSQFQGSSSSRKTQSKLGRTANGTSGRVDPTVNRVDRLRLLGNGVVPQVAERAIRILIERIRKWEN